MRLKEIAKKLIFRVFGEDINNKITKMSLLIRHPNGREHMIHRRCGLYPDTTYYLIRRKSGETVRKLK